MTTEKVCLCGHTKNKHMMTQKDTSLFDFILHHQRFAPLQEGKGQCMICECPEYDPPGRFKSNEKIEYSLRPICHEEPEERCSQCGRLLENHKDIDHPFRGHNS